MEKAPENHNHNPAKTWELAVVPEIHRFLSNKEGNRKKSIHVIFFISKANKESIRIILKTQTCKTSNDIFSELKISLRGDLKIFTAILR